MQKLNIYFVIGTIGMAATSMFHILLASILSQSLVPVGFSAFYPLFILFLIVGTDQMSRNNKRLCKPGQASIRS